MKMLLVLCLLLTSCARRDEDFFVVPSKCDSTIMSIGGLKC